MKPDADHSCVLQCVRAVYGQVRLNGEALADVNWACVRTAAEQQQVSPLVYEAIKEARLENRLPPEARNGLLMEYHRTGMRNEFIEQRIGKILLAAAGKGIEVMLLKGAVLAYRTYARPEHRGFGDVDLLVREADLAGLREVLGGFEYRTSLPNLRDRDLPRYAHYVQQFRLHSSTVPPLEVHFRLINMGVPTAEEPAWDDAVAFEFGGAQVCHPSPERFLLHLCMHAQQHSFAVLRMFVDIAVWHRSHPIDTERFVALARRHHMGTTAYYALTYTDDLLGLPDSELMRTLLRPSAWKRQVFERLWRDQQVRSLKVRLGSMEAELPRTFLLGEAPLREKAVFLWNVLLPPSSWLDSSNGSATRRRLRHIGRILNGARRGLLGADTSGR